jgi:hypothetical protein
MRLPVVVCLGSLFAFAVPAFAQTNDSTQPERPAWGVAVSLTPRWDISGGSDIIGKLAEVWFERGDEGLDIEGSDFRIGVVRGTGMKGEWGVSFVRRSFKEGSTQGAIETNCFDSGFGPETCFTGGTEYIYGDDVRLTGLEANKLFVFATIKDRVQIGLDLAGGIGWMKGTALERRAESEGGSFEFDPDDPGPIIFPFTIFETDVPTSSIVALDPVPIGRVELAVGVAVTQALNVRISGGLNLPGTHVFSVTAGFFFR